MPLTAVLKKLRDRQDLSAEETRAALDAIFTGAVAEPQIGDFLLALRDKGESADELLGAVQSMRGKAVTISAPAGAIDIVGTGGDGHGTLNVSTAAALVVAACGVPVAKHGNRAASSRSGSSDVLAALGINLEPPPAVLEQCLAEANLCFLFAPRHHPAMRHVAALRRQLGVRTIFNLLGPLTNPANVKNHLIGVYDPRWLQPMAQVLQALGSRSAWLAHGQDGMDEITVSADSDIVTMNEAGIGAFALSPEQAGIARHPAGSLAGGEAAFNAAALRELLAGRPGAYRDSVTINAAAALIVAGETADLGHGATLAAQAIDSGAARQCLDKLVTLTNRKTL